MPDLLGSVAGTIRVAQVAHLLDAMARKQTDGDDDGSKGKWVLGRTIEWQQVLSALMAPHLTSFHDEANLDYMHTLHHELMSIPGADPEFVDFEVPSAPIAAP